MLKCPLCYDFKPHYHGERLALIRIPRDPRIFVVAHGDLFGDWVPQVCIEYILGACRKVPKEMWFFETKNPQRYITYLDRFPKNTVLSTTIETNRTYPTEIRGYTPSPIQRFKAMIQIRENSRIPIHVSCEPLLDFDIDVMVAWLKRLMPIKVAVGYDSLHNNLPEPTKEKTLKFIEELEKFTDVERKQL